MEELNTIIDQQNEEEFRDKMNGLANMEADKDYPTGGREEIRSGETEATVEMFLDFLPANMHSTSWSWLALQMNIIFAQAAGARARG